MKEQTLLEMRTLIDRQGKVLTEQVVPKLNALIHNHELMRERIENQQARVECLELLAMASLWGRLKWLLTGAWPVMAVEQVGAPIMAEAERDAA